MNLSPRKIVLVAACGAALVGMWLLLDYLVVSEEERLEAFSEAVTGEMTAERIDEALEYVDLSSEPLEVVVLGESTTFVPGEAEDLAAWVHRRSSFVIGGELRLISRSIEIDGTSARVVVSGGAEEGVIEMSFELTRQTEGWRIRRARFSFDRTGGLHLF